jgi:hypothetical protein
LFIRDRSQLLPLADTIGPKKVKDETETLGFKMRFKNEIEMDALTGITG